MLSGQESEFFVGKRQKSALFFLRRLINTIFLPAAIVSDRIRKRIEPVAQGPAERALAPLGGFIFFISWGVVAISNTVGWVGYGIVIGLSILAFLCAFIASGRRLTHQRISPAVMGYALVCCLTVFTSSFKLITLAAGALMMLTTVVGLMLAVAFPLRQLMKIFSSTMLLILAMSWLFEAFVSLVIRHPLAPLYMGSWSEVPPMYFWSNNELLHGGPIQGIVANRNPLAFIALLALLCVIVQYLDRQRSLVNALLWSGLSVLTLVFTRSATVSVAAVACMIVLITGVIYRQVSPAYKRRAKFIIIALALLAVVAALLGHSEISALLGRDSDMTGRSEIWERVLALWRMRPIAGWGWTMVWIPWIPMFRYLVVHPDGTPTMEAHNAWIEALFQTGVIGFAVLVLGMVWIAYKVYRTAFHQIDTEPLVLLPALLLTALLIQSLTESHLLYRGNWVLLCAIAGWLVIHVRESRVQSRREVGRYPLKGLVKSKGAEKSES